MNILYTISMNAARAGDIEYSKHLGELIKKLHQRTRIRIPFYIKRGLCKKCHVALIPGRTASIRLKSQGKYSYIVIRCLVCGQIHRYPYKGHEKKNIAN